MIVYFVIKDFADLKDWQLEWEESYEVRDTRRQLVNSTNVVIRVLSQEDRDALRLAQQIDRGQTENVYERFLKLYGGEGPAGFAYKPKTYGLSGQQLCDDVLYKCPSKVIIANNVTGAEIGGDTGLDVKMLGIVLGLSLGLVALVLCFCAICIRSRERMSQVYASYKKGYATYKQEAKELKALKQTKSLQKRVRSSSMRPGTDILFDQPKAKGKGKGKARNMGIEPSGYTARATSYETVMSRLQGLAEEYDVLDLENIPTHDMFGVFLADAPEKAQAADLLPPSSSPVNFQVLTSDAGRVSPPRSLSPPREISSAVKDELDKLAELKLNINGDQPNGTQGSIEISQMSHASVKRKRLSANPLDTPKSDVVIHHRLDLLHKHVWSTEALLDYDPTTSRGEVTAPPSGNVTPRLNEIDAHLSFLKDQIHARERELSALSSECATPRTPRLGLSQSASFNNPESDHFLMYLNKGFDDR
jgi:hypothetical protein